MFRNNLGMALKDKLAQIKEQFSQLKGQGIFPPKMTILDKVLVLGVLGFMSLGAIFVTAALSWVASDLYKKVAPVHHVASHESSRDLASEDSEHSDNQAHTEEHGSETTGEHSESTENSATVQLGADIIPKEIRKRQDGVRESDYDLADPEITQEKGLAGFFEKDLEVSVGYRTVDITEIVSGSRMGNMVDAMVYLDVVFEVATHDAQKEIESRRTEIKSLVSSLVGSFSAEYLKSLEGKEALKLEIFKEMNRILQNGKVTDVLLANFMIR